MNILKNVMRSILRRHISRWMTTFRGVTTDLAGLVTRRPSCQPWPCTGRLREGAKYYVKRFRRPYVAVPGHRYSLVRLMCFHPRGETWASNSGGGVDAGLFAGQDRLAHPGQLMVAVHRW